MLGIIKGDIRYEALAKMLPSVLSGELYDFIGIDTLLLPFGGIDEYYNIKQSKLNLLDILKENDIKTIFVGNANSRLKEVCSHKNIRLIELLQELDFIIPNAKLTSMGIIDYLSRGDVAVSDLKISIIGYGNIGYTLAELLDSYGTKFTILPMNKEEEKFIKLKGYKLNEIDESDILINTVPKNLDWEYSRLIDKRIIDVASAPYGFDIEKIEQLKIKYEIVGAIPSKFAPTSAAKILKKYIEKNV